MKELNNYKKIRVKPYLYGFTFKSITSAIGITILATFIMFANMEINKVKLLIWVLIIVVNIVINRYILGEVNYLEKIFQNKFPKELTDLTKK